MGAVSVSPGLVAAKLPQSDPVESRPIRSQGPEVEIPTS